MVKNPGAVLLVILNVSRLNGAVVSASVALTVTIGTPENKNNDETDEKSHKDRKFTHVSLQHDYCHLVSLYVLNISY